MKRLDMDLKQREEKGEDLTPLYLLQRMMRLRVFPTRPSKERREDRKPDSHHLILQFVRQCKVSFEC